MHRRAVWLAALALAAAAPAAAQDPAAEFDRAYARFTEAYRRADPAMVAALYADDAFYLVPGDTIARGHAEILRQFTSYLDSFRREGRPGPEVSFQIVDRAIAGDLATDIGYYTLNGSRGKFIVVWKKGADGRWRIHADGYSFVDPPRPPAAPQPADTGAPMALSPAELARYAGTYRSASPAMEVQVEAAGGVLRLTAPGMPAFEIAPSGTRFRGAAADAPPNFRADFRVEGDRPVRLVVSPPGGQPIVLERVP
jgi:ketosteroid isomerase-like protein